VIVARHASKWARRRSSTQTLLSFAQTLPPRQRQEPTGSAAAWSLSYEARPRSRTLFGSTCELSQVSCRLAAIDGDIDTRAPCGRTYVYCTAGLALYHVLSCHSTRRQDRGRLCNRCCTRGWCCVAPDVAVRDRSREPRMERTERGNECSRPA